MTQKKGKNIEREKRKHKEKVRRRGLVSSVRLVNIGRIFSNSDIGNGNEGCFG